MRIRWTAPAAEDLYRIIRYIRRDNPGAARDMAKAIYDGCHSLTRFPNRGRPGVEPGTREVVFAPLHTLPFIASGNPSSKSCASGMVRKTDNPST